MRCELFIENIDACLDETLSHEMRIQMREHALECENCSGELSRAQAVHADLAKLKDRLPPPNYTDIMMNAVRAETAGNSKAGGKRPRKITWKGISAIAAAAAAVVIGVPLMGVLLFSRAGGATPGSKYTANDMVTMEYGMAESQTAPAPADTARSGDMMLAGGGIMEDAGFEMGTSGNAVSDYGEPEMYLEKEYALNEEQRTQTDAAFGLKIIRTGDIALETRQFDEDFQKLLDMVNAFSGYTENHSSSGVPYDVDPNSYGRWGSITARVPSQALDAFIDEAKKTGNTTRASVYSEDITSRYQDTELELTTLRAQHERLLELVAKAEDVSDLITLEQELQRIQYKMDALTGTLRGWDSRVEYSSVSIYVTEVKSYTSVQPVDPSLGERSRDAFFRSINSLITLAQSALVGVIAALPFITVLAIVAAVIITVAMVLRKRGKRVERKSK